MPFGLVGGRLYHVATDHQRYFGADGDPWQILYVWRGGLGVWGSIALGAVGGIIGAWRQGHADRARWSTRWRRACSSPRRSAGGATGSTRSCSASPPTCRGRSRSTREYRPPGYEDQATFHPTFLYECIWNLTVFGVLIALDRRFKFGHGRMLALYVMGYTLGRGWIEMLRIDTVELDDVAGLRFNVWTSIVLFVVALAYFLVSRRLRPGQEESVYVEAPASTPAGDEPVDGHRSPTRPARG